MQLSLLTPAARTHAPLGATQYTEGEYCIALAPDWIYDLWRGDEIIGYTAHAEPMPRHDPQTLMRYIDAPPLIWRTYMRTGTGVEPDGFTMVYSGYEQQLALDTLWQRRHEAV